MINFNRFKEIIDKHTNFVITSHINPDGDAIGSEIALAYFLRKLSKRVWIINHSRTPSNFLFLDEENLIQKYEPGLDEWILSADVLAAIDFNSISRVKSMIDVFTKSKALKICIDHHSNPQNFVDELFCDTEYSATGEIIYELIQFYNSNLIDKKIADNLYAAIMTDTGSFRFERTTPRVHQIIAELIQKGANPTELFNKIYNELSFEKVRLMGEAIKNIKTDFDGKISYMVIDRKLLKKSDATEEDVDGFVNFCLAIKSVQVGILFFELTDGVKASLRSKNTFAVSRLAEKFGGGGHINAAGIRFSNLKLDEVIPKLLTQTKEDLIEYEKGLSND